MFLKFRVLRVISIAILCWPVGVIADNNWVDSITLGFGYSNANSSLSDLNGGVAGVSEPASDGRGFAATLVFDYDVLPRLSPYVDIANLIQDDRDFLIPSVGLRYQFETEKGVFQPFLSVGAGYVFSEWNESPVDNASVSEPSGESFGVNLQGGVDMFISENLALNLTARFDAYDIGTTVVENSRVTTIEDKSSFSALIGLTYRFGEKRRKDDDADGVSNSLDKCPDTIRGAPVDANGCALDSDGDGVIDLYDCCPDTLPGVPITQCGCPPWKFDFNLELEFDEFRIADYRHRPVFDIVGFLMKHPEYHVRITGHTDDVGSARYNLALSQWRANAARDFLVDKGIAGERVEARGKGEEDPLVDNLTEEHRAMNRRIFVEIYRADMKLSTEIEPVPAKVDENGEEAAQ